MQNGGKCKERSTGTAPTELTLLEFSFFIILDELEGLRQWKQNPGALKRYWDGRSYPTLGKEPIINCPMEDIDYRGVVTKYSRLPMEFR